MYDTLVKFSSTNNYGCNLQNDEDDVYTIEEFIECCECGAFIDYDGHGYPVKDNLSDWMILIKPSTLDKIPQDATHIVWYNR
jgi:hypothetical protein